MTPIATANQPKRRLPTWVWWLLGIAILLLVVPKIISVLRLVHNRLSWVGQDDSQFDGAPTVSSELIKMTTSAEMWTVTGNWVAEEENLGAMIAPTDDGTYQVAIVRTREDTAVEFWSIEGHYDTKKQQLSYTDGEHVWLDFDLLGNYDEQTLDSRTQGTLTLDGENLLWRDESGSEIIFHREPATEAGSTTGFEDS